MKITEDNFTITTIYFDGQFWCALIEQWERKAQKRKQKKLEEKEKYLVKKRKKRK